MFFSILCNNNILDLHFICIVYNVHIISIVNSFLNEHILFIKKVISIKHIFKNIIMLLFEIFSSKTIPIRYSIKTATIWFSDVLFLLL